MAAGSGGVMSARVPRDLRSLRAKGAHPFSGSIASVSPSVFASMPFFAFPDRRAVGRGAAARGERNARNMEEEQYEQGASFRPQIGGAFALFGAANLISMLNN